LLRESSAVEFGSKAEYTATRSSAAERRKSVATAEEACAQLQFEMRVSDPLPPSAVLHLTEGENKAVTLQA